MTTELAIRILTGEVLGTSEQTHEAIKMAVKALSLQDVAYINVGDTISRQDAIDLLKKWSDGYIYIETETESAIKDFQQLPTTQTEPDPEWRRKHYEESYNQGFVDGCKLYGSRHKKGKWVKEKCRSSVYKCSACGNYLDFSGVNAGRGNANFCPNCGADMRTKETDCDYERAVEQL